MWFPVGLFGLHTYTIVVSSFMACSIASRSWSYVLVSGTAIGSDHATIVEMRYITNDG